jgi:hypothetical protein
MSYDLYLSYSGRKSYLVCPKQYEFRYVVKLLVVRDVKNTLLGTSIGKIFEWFYSMELWKRQDVLSVCLALAPEAVEKTLKEEKFDAASEPGLQATLECEVRALIPGGLEAIRVNEFLTPLSRAEADLTTECQSEKYGMTLKLGGRADFIHGRGRENLWIVDGKASKHREKYVDSEQLIWYGVQHYVKYHVFPSRLGFIFWSFPDNPVTWIEYGPADMRASVDKTFETAKKIRLKQFEATPSSECYRCDYRSHCDDGARWVANRKIESGGRIESSVFDPEIVT